MIVVLDPFPFRLAARTRRRSSIRVSMSTTRLQSGEAGAACVCESPKETKGDGEETGARKKKDKKRDGEAAGVVGDRAERAEGEGRLFFSFSFSWRLLPLVVGAFWPVGARRSIARPALCCSVSLSRVHARGHSLYFLFFCEKCARHFFLASALPRPPEHIGARQEGGQRPRKREHQTRQKIKKKRKRGWPRPPET